jgi:hypothetical protein
MSLSSSGGPGSKPVSSTDAGSGEQRDSAPPRSREPLPRWCPWKFRRRERKAHREAAALYDALTVEGRAATAMASSLTYQELCHALDALKQLAIGGSIQALRELRAWIELSTRLAGQQESTEGVDWAEMTPAQRATARAAVEKRLREIALAAGEDAEDAGA